MDVIYLYKKASTQYGLSRATKSRTGIFQVLPHTINYFNKVCVGVAVLWERRMLLLPEEVSKII